jgi:glycosyltransferase involved in cell wall biosynthesis
VAAITIGVPVFNEAARLGRCLDNLRDQTFTDFEVLILDNASEDATGEVAKTYAAQDKRFRYTRQPINRGQAGNHHDVMLAATSPYFHWRAADDSSDLNYLEVLHGLLEANPAKSMAVGRDLGIFEGEVIRTTHFPRLKNDRGLSDLLKLMFGGPPSWFYGLYRREVLAPIVARVGRDYATGGWGHDFIIDLPFFMDHAVIGTDATTFRVALRPRRGAPGQPEPPRTEPDLDMMLAIRSQFLGIAQTFVDERARTGAERAFWAIMLRLYADRRVYKTKHILRRGARRLIGLKP